MKSLACTTVWSHTVRLFALAALAALGGTAACSGNNSNDFSLSGDDGGPTSPGTTTGSGSGVTGGSSSGGGGACVACVSDHDCGTGVCAQLAGDSYCTPLCPNGNECSTGDSCVTLSSVEGAQVNGCVPRGGTCGTGTGSGDAGASSGSSSGGTASSSGSGSGSSSGGNTCGTLVGPSVSAGCSSCSKSSSTCQANGCYGGWYCDTATSKCQSPPTSCSGGGSSGGSGGSSSGGSSSGGSLDAGPPPTGTVGSSGGTLSRLYFAVVGDTRPGGINDTAGYPTAIITKIYQDMENFSPRPAFGVSTGDYMFATPGSGNAAPQLSLYTTARAGFSSVMFPAMGNHECTGATASNCGSGTTDGVTENYSTFMSQMLQPLGQSNPYYVIHINDTAGTWTAKFVFVAANAWTSAQSSWLDSTLAQATTYTFLVRHESASANTAPGVSPAEVIMAKYPYTLSIVGHSHTYNKSGSKEVIIGNGGAPLTGGVNYGFGLLQQRADKAIQVDMIDYSTLQPDTSFRFAVNPDGTAAP